MADLKNSKWPPQKKNSFSSSTNSQYLFMKFSWKNIENWRSWKMRFFWGGHFEFSKSAILNFFASSLWKIQPFYMRYHFFSALWMVFPESWKRSCPNFYAHDCTQVTIKFLIEGNGIKEYGWLLMSLARKYILRIINQH